MSWAIASIILGALALIAWAMWLSHRTQIHAMELGYEYRPVELPPERQKPCGAPPPMVGQGEKRTPKEHGQLPQP